ncbi:ATP-dependent zinc metalloprotease FtsH [TM7 phylum sp. oral taxon 352]|jgi:ATP-dependent metalloprotease FtsH|uniref:ATP-dependent zinc metalloprotease FtsH n=1 Tax=unclassified Candidatus Nanosynbacter TaxID=2725944 RepID=UPI00101BF4C4|nr:MULTISPECIES: ATP-dependent zinc metalloprotease FtsH [unclassified Candidatus Nanosynbacter]MCJ1967360.1 ATP-dependent zinc metalloprotease FtsH [Candidatus Nanosynbacter sp. TM7-075]TWP16509.1 ATP-dependent zinc metalloprotease FtsH [TM7 phylum sp. oral taxon 352]UOG67255.1 ATP-dependent zinc metalloprotease FtsH [Candidatus Nanosynbacter sp. HMT-352]
MAVKMPQRNGKNRISQILRFGLFWAIIIFVALIFYATLFPASNLKDVALSDVVRRANDGKIAQLEIQGNDIKITPKDQSKPTEHSVKESSSIYEQGLNKDAKVEVKVIPPSTTGETMWNLAVMVVPVLIIVVFFMFMMRQAQGQNNQAMGFGKSKARLYGQDKEKVLFTDIAGNDNAKQDLQEVVDFLKHPKKYKDLGAKIPKGVLLVGNPGTGKTMLARAVAGEAGVPFFSISGSEFVEMFVGVGASRVRDLFSKAKKNAPCIIFIDEIDAVGRKRGSGMGGGHDEREQTLNQILVEMDGFDGETNVIVLAATNRADVLDPALLRPGRFDRRVNITLPERKDREAILKVHFKKKPTDETVDLDKLAAKTAGSSGADLANMANEAAIIAARRNKKKISNDELTEAFERVAIGPERKTKIMNDHEKELTAYHEAGHAIVGHVLPDSDPVHKVTIIPRGGTGGVTWFLPPEDKSYTNVYEFKDILARAMGGRIAEQLIYGDDGITTGAGSDLRKATEIARDMVIEQGMGKGLRDQVFHEDNGGLMFDKMTRERPYSDETAKMIDEEVAQLITEAKHRAMLVLKENRSFLDKLAEALLKEETLEESEVDEILKGTKLPKEAKLHS